MTETSHLHQIPLRIPTVELFPIWILPITIYSWTDLFPDGSIDHFQKILTQTFLQRSPLTVPSDSPDSPLYTGVTPTSSRLVEPPSLFCFCLLFWSRRVKKVDLEPMGEKQDGTLWFLVLGDRKPEVLNVIVRGTRQSRNPNLTRCRGPKPIYIGPHRSNVFRTVL